MSTPDLVDPIMDEVYATRRRISARYGHDPERLAAAARERMQRDQKTGDRRYAQLPIARVPSAA